MAAARFATVGVGVVLGVGVDEALDVVAGGADDRGGVLAVPVHPVSSSPTRIAGSRRRRRPVNP